jgi:regulator of protease activity HflC (stomatin/prohibitin superfamily)
MKISPFILWFGVAAVAVMVALGTIMFAPLVPGGPITVGAIAIGFILGGTLLARAGLRIVPEYNRLVIFRLGKCVGARGPGMVYVSPVIERPISVDLRERFHEVSHESCITKDNAKIDVDFLFYWKVVNPVWSQTRVQNLEASLEGLATGLLRAVIGGFQLDEALAQRERINEELKDKLEEVSEHWGVTVTTVEIREILPPKDIQDAMHRQLAAERDRRAAMLKAQGQRESDILRAEGEAMALERLYRAAKEIDPKTLQIKYLEALTEVGRSGSTKYVFPLEFTQFIRPFVQNLSAETPKGDSAISINGDELAKLMKTLVEMASQFKGGNGELAATETPQLTASSTPSTEIVAVAPEEKKTPP